MEFRLNIPDSAWEPNDALDDPRTRMKTTLVINGVSHHLEAIEVKVDEDNGLQEAVSPEDHDEFQAILDAVHGDGHFDTVEIEGREYVLIATPY